VLTLSSLASPPLKTAKATENSSQSNWPCAILTPHVTPLPNAVRSCTSFFGFVLDLMGDGLRFLWLTVRSHSALSAEVLFLRKQLAFYEERERQPRRLTNSARLSLALWSQLFHWKSVWQRIRIGYW